MNKKENQKNEKYAVYLNIYDFTKANCCLSSLGLGIYHTGVQINDVQYNFCVVDTNKNTTGVIQVEPETAMQKFNKKIYYGEISIKLVDLRQIIKNLEKKYICGKYHLFECNCNHFSNQLIEILLEKTIPKQMFRFTNCLAYFCCWLPDKVLNGQYALEAMQQQMKKQQQKQKNLI